MTHDEIRQRVLDGDWTLDDLDAAAVIREHLKTCQACREAVEDYDRLRATMQSLAAGATGEPTPREGWTGFVRGLTGIGSADEDSASRIGGTSKGASGDSSGDTSGGGGGGRGRGSFVLRRPWWGQALAAAAAIIVGVVIGWSVNTSRPSAPQMVTVPAESNNAKLQRAALPSREDVRQQTEAFTEVSRVLDHRASWVSLSSASENVGLAPAPIEGEQRLLLLRLTVLRRDAIVSQSDLAIVLGQTAELSVPFESGRTLRYVIATSATAPPRLSLWASLNHDNAVQQTLAALATQLPIEPGHVRSAGELATAAGEYRIKIGFEEARLPPENPTENPSSTQP